MILDLNTFLDEVITIPVLGGGDLKIPKPNQAMVMKILAMQNIDENTPEEKVKETLNALASDILNSNINGIHVSRESIEALSDHAKTDIVILYTEFMRKLQSNPIIPRPDRRKKRKALAGIANFFRVSKT